jgi:hypothetical protein
MTLPRRGAGRKKSGSGVFIQPPKFIPGESVETDYMAFKS